MSRKPFIIIGLVVLIATVAVIAWAWSQRLDPGSGDTISTPVQDSFLVRYNGTSFQPQEITVRKGTKVLFLNESSQQRPMYVASDDHPTHERYPGFDTAAVNQKFPALSESFSYVFDRVGTWGYHDHNSPSARGIIIVE